MRWEIEASNRIYLDDLYIYHWHDDGWSYMPIFRSHLQCRKCFEAVPNAILFQVSLMDQRFIRLATGPGLRIEKHLLIHGK